MVVLPLLPKHSPCSRSEAESWFSPSLWTRNRSHVYRIDTIGSTTQYRSRSQERLLLPRASYLDKGAVLPSHSAFERARGFMRQRRLLIIGTALVLNVLTCMYTMAPIQPPVASAHAYVIDSDPVDGSTIAQVKAVHIFFNADISPLSRAHVYFIQGADFFDAEASTSQVAP